MVEKRYEVNKKLFKRVYFALPALVGLVTLGMFTIPVWIAVIASLSLILAALIHKIILPSLVIILTETSLKSPTLTGEVVSIDFNDMQVSSSMGTGAFNRVTYRSKSDEFKAITITSFTEDFIALTTEILSRIPLDSNNIDNAAGQ